METSKHLFSSALSLVRVYFLRDNKTFIWKEQIKSTYLKNLTSQRMTNGTFVFIRISCDLSFCLVTLLSTCCEKTGEPLCDMRGFLGHSILHYKVVWRVYYTLKTLFLIKLTTSMTTLMFRAHLALTPLLMSEWALSGYNLTAVSSFYYSQLFSKNAYF